MTQKEEILSYMRANGSITSKEAMDSLGCMRLASRIHDLVNDGWKIERETVTVKTRHGKARVTRYSFNGREADVLEENHGE